MPSLWWSHVLGESRGQRLCYGSSCTWGCLFFFFLLFRVGLWPRTWSLFLQVPRACAPFFWLFRVGCLGQLSVSSGWDLLMDGAPGCGWDLTGVARVGAKCPCLSFCSSGCACFAFPLGFCFSLHAGATAPATIVGRLVFWFFFSFLFLSFCFSPFCLLGLAGCCLLGTAGATAPATVGAFFCHGWHMLPMLISEDGGGPGHLHLA